LIQKELTEDEERDLKDNVRTHMKASEKAKFKNLGAADGVSKILIYAFVMAFLLVPTNEY
jgi:hypothetical protein